MISGRFKEKELGIFNHKSEFMSFRLNSQTPNILPKNLNCNFQITEYRRVSETFSYLTGVFVTSDLKQNGSVLLEFAGKIHGFGFYFYDHNNNLKNKNQYKFAIYKNEEMQKSFPRIVLDYQVCSRTDQITGLFG